MSDQSHPGIVLARVLDALEAAADPYSPLPRPLGLGPLALGCGEPPMPRAEAQARQRELRRLLATSARRPELDAAVERLAGLLREAVPLPPAERPSD